MDQRTQMLRFAAAVHATWQFIDRRRREPGAFDVMPTPSFKGQTVSPTYRLDIEAEDHLHREIQRRLESEGLPCSGEERPVDRAVLEAAEMFAVTDALDGSRLLAIGMNHWVVAAALVRNGAEAGVSTSAVADSEGRIFCAHQDLAGVFDGTGQAYRLTPSSRRGFSGAVVAFDGRTPAKLRAAQDHLGAEFMELGWLMNVAGGPAILRVMGGQLDATWGRMRGYDFVPEAFLAEKGGVYVKSFDGSAPPYRRAVLDREEKFDWVVAATPELGEALCRTFRSR